jgi:hypothetical protein
MGLERTLNGPSRLAHPRHDFRVALGWDRVVSEIAVIDN